MREVWKFPIQHPGRRDGSFPVVMPHDSKILSIQIQKGEPVMWALVETSNRLETRVFQTFGTGHELPADEMVYRGTYQLIDGAFVGHLFEIME